jgi:hypothetical protein
MSYMMAGWWHYEKTIGGHLFHGLGHTLADAVGDYRRELRAAHLDVEAAMEVDYGV